MHICSVPPVQIELWPLSLSLKVEGYTIDYLRLTE